MPYSRAIDLFFNKSKGNSGCSIGEISNWRIDKCKCCHHITEQIDNVSLLGEKRWYCLNCSTYADIYSSDFKQYADRTTKYTEKDIGLINNPKK